jgi:hypothetical protein
MKIFLIILATIILTQAASYTSSELISVIQNKCYPLYSQGKVKEYEACFNNEKVLNITSNILGFDFIYTGRKLIYGY